MSGFTVRQDEHGRRLLVEERWPPQVIFDPELLACMDIMPERIGDDFRIDLDNARAVYRYTALKDGMLVCDLIRGETCRQ